MWRSAQIIRYSLITVFKMNMPCTLPTKNATPETPIPPGGNTFRHPLG